MKTSEKQKTADVLTERSYWTRIGLLPIRLRPLTLGQIYEMGVYINDIDSSNLDMRSKINVTAEMLAKYENAPLMQEVYLICAFRRRWRRRLFRRYILKRLTVGMFQRVMDVITNAYTANFFLTSIIFLHQTKPMTEPKQTTARGQQSEE